MKVKLLTDKMVTRMPNPRPCPLCRRAVRSGQYVLHQKLDPVAFADTTWMIHVACLRPIVASTPEDESDLSAARQEALHISRVLAGIMEDAGIPSP